MANKNFIVKNGITVGGTEVVSSSGVVTSAALGGQTLASGDSPTFNNLTLTNDIAVGGDLNLTGDLNITGDVNSLSVTDLDVTDQTITLGAGQVESASGGSGIIVDGSNASLLWNETNDVFDINKGISITGSTLVSDDQTNDWVKQSVSGTTSTLTFGNTESTAGQAKWEYTRSDGRFKGYIGANAVNNFMSITSLGLIGIGTDNPDSDLHISSATGVELHLQEETAGQAATLKLTNTQNSFVVGADANPQMFFINTDGNQGSGICMDTSHNVGIGTDSPSRELELSAANPRFRITDTDGGYSEISGNSGHLSFSADTGNSQGGTRITFDIDGAEKVRIDSSGNLIMTAGGTIRAGGANDLILDAGESGTPDIYLQSGGSTKIKIEGSNGNVGIGESTPLSRLHVVSGTPTSTPKDTYAVALFDDGEGRIQVRATNNGSDGAVVGLSTGSHNWGLMATAAGTLSNAFAIGYVDTSTDGNVFGVGSMSEKLIITTAGNVGIGGIYPGHRLHINGGDNDQARVRVTNTASGQASLDLDNSEGYFRTYTDAGEYRIYDQTDGAHRMVIDTAGKVGIGTDTPQTSAKGLHVVHDANEGTPSFPSGEVIIAQRNFNSSQGCHIGIIGGSASESTINFGDKDNSDAGIISYKHNGDYMTFTTNTAEALKIEASGDLTVGTSSAGFHFDVSTQLLSTTFGTGGNLTLACTNSSGSGVGGQIFLGGDSRGDINKNAILFKNGSDVTRYSIDEYGTLMSQGVDSSYAHNTYAHAAVFSRNSVPNGTVVIEDMDVSSGIGNTVLRLFLRDQDPATHAVFISFGDGGGSVGSVTHNDDGGGVSFNTVSDYRLKENVDYDWDATTLLKQLKPAKYNFIANPSKTVQGMLAHEVSDIVPSSVRGDRDHMMEIGTITDSDGDIVSEDVYEHFCKTDEGQTWTQTGTEPLYQQLDYSRLVPLLTKALQEQQTIIDDLKARLDEAGL